MITYMKLLIVILAVLFVLFILFYKFWFLRNPQRATAKGNNIVSPADGRIIRILAFDKKPLKIKKGFGIIKTLTKDVAKTGYLISIFMSPFNVHYQRAPLDGKVMSVKYTKGNFFAANSLKALENEKNEILIKTRIGNIKVIQIAGIIARRIVCFARKNQNIKKGEQIGLIKLGSQICLITPKLKLNVKQRQKVKAGETVIAEIGK